METDDVDATSICNGIGFFPSSCCRGVGFIRSSYGDPQPCGNGHSTQKPGIACELASISTRRLYPNIFDRESSCQMDPLFQPSILSCYIRYGRSFAF